MLAVIFFFIGFFNFKPSCLWKNHCRCSYWPESWVKRPWSWVGDPGKKRWIPCGTCPGQTGEKDAEGRIVKDTPFSSRLPLDTLDHSSWSRELWAESGSFYCLFKLSTQYSKIPKDIHPWSPVTLFDCWIWFFALDTSKRTMNIIGIKLRLSSLGWEVFNNCYPVSSCWQFIWVSGRKSSGSYAWTQQESGGWHGIR